MIAREHGATGAGGGNLTPMYIKTMGRGLGSHWLHPAQKDFLVSQADEPARQLISPFATSFPPPPQPYRFAIAVGYHSLTQGRARST
jgi:hypothetical protein